MGEERIFSLIKRIHDRSTMLKNRRLKTYGMTAVQWDALSYLIECNSVISQKELEDRLGVTHSAAAGIVSRLEMKNLISTCINEIDRRQKLLHPTPEGLSVYKELCRSGCRFQRELMEGLSVEETRMLEELLERIYHNLGI